MHSHVPPSATGRSGISRRRRRRGGGGGGGGRRRARTRWRGRHDQRHTVHSRIELASCGSGSRGAECVRGCVCACVVVVVGGGGEGRRRRSQRKPTKPKRQPQQERKQRKEKKRKEKKKKKKKKKNPTRKIQQKKIRRQRDDRLAQCGHYGADVQRELSPNGDLHRFERNAGIFGRAKTQQRGRNGQFKIAMNRLRQSQKNKIKNNKKKLTHPTQKLNVSQHRHKRTDRINLTGDVEQRTGNFQALLFRGARKAVSGERRRPIG